MTNIIREIMFLARQYHDFTFYLPDGTTLVFLCTCSVSALPALEQKCCKAHWDSTEVNSNSRKALLSWQHQSRVSTMPNGGGVGSAALSYPMFYPPTYQGQICWHGSTWTCTSNLKVTGPSKPVATARLCQWQGDGSPFTLRRPSACKIPLWDTVEVTLALLHRHGISIWLGC